MSAYIKALQATASPVAAPPQPTSLRARFLVWYDNLPPVSKHRPFAMQEFEQALNTQGRFLSPILLTLGWERKRKWSTSGQYHRYWIRE